MRREFLQHTRQFIYFYFTRHHLITPANMKNTQWSERGFDNQPSVKGKTSQNGGRE